MIILKEMKKLSTGDPLQLAMCQQDSPPSEIMPSKKQTQAKETAKEGRQSQCGL